MMAARCGGLLRPAMQYGEQEAMRWDNQMPIFSAWMAIRWSSPSPIRTSL
jgi:hypothetical protein